MGCGCGDVKVSWNIIVFSGTPQNESLESEFNDYVHRLNLCRKIEMENRVTTQKFINVIDIFRKCIILLHYSNILIFIV